MKSFLSIYRRIRMVDPEKATTGIEPVFASYRPRGISGGTESRRRKRGSQPYGLLYAIEPQHVGVRSPSAPIKLGYTRDQASLERRRATLQTSHWLELAVVWIATGTMESERLLHRELADHRIRGEWFDNAPEVWAELLKLAPRIERVAA